MKRAYIFSLAVVFALVLLALSGGPEHRGQASSSIEAGVEAVMQGVSVVASREGKVLWRLKAARAVIPSGGEIASLDAVDLEVPSEELYIKAASGSYDLSTSDLTLSDGVMANTGQMVLHSSDATFSAATGVVSTESPVFVEGRGFKVRGLGFRAKGKQITITHQVEAEIE